jgi:ferric-dicitrate binding protein FerR (iron transport regulator)
MLLGAVLLLGAAFLYAQVESSRVLVREVTGTVEVKEPGAADWSPVRQGQSVARAAAVSTGFRSTAVIEVGNSLITVQPLTRLTVDEILAASGNEQVNVNLQTGRIRADVKPPAGGRTEFTVRSPSATASVRGTSFEFDGIRLAVDEGRVHVTGGDQTGTYVGVGHEVRTETDSGRTVGAVEILKEDLTPPVPAGMDSTPEVKLAPPAGGSVELGFNWN